MDRQSIFVGALERPTLAEREAYLSSACGSDVALRQEVNALLQAYERAGGFLDTPIVDGELTDRLRAEVTEVVAASRRNSRQDPLIGSVVGRYKLLQRIGEGGMGVVYMAEQREPVKRKVALKILKLGLDSDQVIARFEAERQALAVLDHNGIAKVFDAGTTETNRPYFVMELVYGLPITQYCDEARLGPRERAELFMAVCHAVHHAHQKGIIHRDLKPSNILVASYDGRAVPKIIDFGVAKATNQSLTQRTLFTNFGALIGTLEYMAPEQAQMNALGVDTRSDIYSLGVLLYELLTGTTPLESARLHQAAFNEALRLIGEEEPPRPSTRLSSIGDQLEHVSARRGTESHRLVRLVCGELDWIAMKCLEKDRSRRYETAHGLANDIGRYLNDEPVLASPPSAVYQITKFARRHKTWLSAAASIFVALLIGLGAATAGLVHAKRESNRAWEASILAAQDRQAAEEARATAEHQRALAERNEEVAKREAAKANAVSRLLDGMLQVSAARSADWLEQAELTLEPTGETADRGVAETFALIRFVHDMRSGRLLKQTAAASRVREFLVRVANALDENTHNDPEVESCLRDNVGAALNAVGMPDEAEVQLRSALEIRQTIFPDDHVEIANSLSNLCFWHIGKGDFAGAYGIAHQALAMRKRLLGPNHKRIVDLHLILSSVAHREGMAEEAAEHSKRALAMLRAIIWPEDSREMSFALSTRAWNFREQGDLIEAETMTKRAIAIAEQLEPSQPLLLAQAYDSLGETLRAQNRLPEAMEAFRGSIKSYRQESGDDNVAIMSPLRTLTQLVGSSSTDNAYADELQRELSRLETYHFGHVSP